MKNQNHFFISVWFIICISEVLRCSPYDQKLIMLCAVWTQNKKWPLSPEDVCVCVDSSSVYRNWFKCRNCRAKSDWWPFRSRILSQAVTNTKDYQGRCKQPYSEPKYLYSFCNQFGSVWIFLRICTHVICFCLFKILFNKTVWKRKPCHYQTNLNKYFNLIWIEKNPPLYVA